MKYEIKDIPKTGTFFTPHQFFLWMEGEKCCHCGNRATWLPKYKDCGNLSYCDDHWPFKDILDSEESG